MDIIAWDGRREYAFFLRGSKKVRDSGQDTVVGVHIVIVQHHQNIVRCRLDRQVSLLANRHRSVHQYIFDIGHIRNQILNLVHTIVHNHPLYLVLRITLCHDIELGEWNEGTAIACNRNHTHIRHILLLREPCLKRILGKVRKTVLEDILDAVDELRMTCLILLARLLGPGLALQILRSHIMLQSIDNRPHIYIF